MTPFTTQWYKQQCEELRIRPEKTRGQNFLIDQTISEKMTKAAQLKKDDLVIEIGPGFGPLTHALCQTKADVHVYDIEKKFATTPIINKLIESGRILFNSEDALKTNETEFQENYSIIANLPYSISSAVLIKFLTSPNPPRQIMLMLQKEVVDKLTEKPPHMTRLSVLAQATATPKKLFNVPRSSFWPQPSIDSTVVHLTNIKHPKHFKTLQNLTKAGFSSKRKKLSNNLKSFTNNPEQLLTTAKLDKNIRAQELSTNDWKRLAVEYDKLTS